MRDPIGKIIVLKGSTFNMYRSWQTRDESDTEEVVVLPLRKKTLQWSIQHIKWVGERGRERGGRGRREEGGRVEGKSEEGWGSEQGGVWVL